MVVLFGLADLVAYPTTLDNRGWLDLVALKSAAGTWHHFIFIVIFFLLQGKDALDDGWPAAFDDGVTRSGCPIVKNS